MSLKSSICQIVDKNVFLLGKKIEKKYNISSAAIYLLHITGKLYKNARFDEDKWIIISDDEDNEILKFNVITEEYFVLD